MIGQINKKIRLGKLQRTLRNNLSDAEQALWHLLRGRQISALKFRRQQGRRFGWLLRSYNPIPLPTSPLKGEVLRKFPSEREEE